MNKILKQSRQDPLTDISLLKEKIEILRYERRTLTERLREVNVELTNAIDRHSELVVSARWESLLKQNQSDSDTDNPSFG